LPTDSSRCTALSIILLLIPRTKLSSLTELDFSNPRCSVHGTVPVWINVQKCKPENRTYPVNSHPGPPKVPYPSSSPLRSISAPPIVPVKGILKNLALRVLLTSGPRTGALSRASRFNPAFILKLLSGTIRLGERAGGRSMMDESDMVEVLSERSSSRCSPDSSFRSMTMSEWLEKMVCWLGCLD